MNPIIIDSAVKCVKSLCDGASTLVRSGDPDNFAKSVEKFNSGVNENYELMREIIKNDDTMSAEKKVEKLQKIAEQEERAKQKAAKAIDHHTEVVWKIVLDVIKGFATCGLIFAPEIVKNVKEVAAGTKMYLDMEPIEVDFAEIEDSKDAIPEFEM